MSTELDLDDVAATSPLAAAELADLRASAARLALERELHGIAAAMENLANERDALRAAQLHNRLVIAQHEEHLGRIQDELSESRCLLESSEAALQEAQRALFRWLPNRIGSEYDDLIAADAMTLMGLESVDGLREIGGEILIELVEKRRLLDEARAQKPVAYMHNKRADVIHTSVKSLLSDFAVNSGPESMLRPIDKSENYTIPLYAAAPVPAQPAVCDDCGALCTPANNAKSHIKRCAACQSAFVASLDSAITAQSAAAPEAAVKDAAAILVQALEEIAWQRPLGVRPSKSGEAMERAAIIALHKYNALLSAADTRSPDKCQCNDDGKVTDACMDCPR